MPKQRSEHVSSLAILRRFLLAFLFAGLVFSGIVSAIYRQDVRHQRVLLEQEAQHILDLQQELLLFEVQAVQSDLLYLASQDGLTQFLSGDMSARGGLEREYVSFALNKAVYDQIRCLDPMGQEIVRINYREGDADVVPQDELQSKATRYYYQQALSLNKGEVFVSPFDLNMEHGQIEQPIKPVIRFLTPVFDSSGEKRGLLVLNYLGAPLLAKLKQIAGGFRGQTMLVNPAGEYLQAPDASHEWGWLLGHQQSFRGDFPEAWNQGKGLGAAKLPVRQSLFTFRRVSPGRRLSVPEMHGTSVVDDQDASGLILVSYVSSSVASAHSRELLKQLMLMCVGVMGAVGLLSLYWARSSELRRYHEQRIAESESRLRQLSSALLSAQETERRNLSRILHDELGQQVTAISLDLRSLVRKEDGAGSNPLLARAIEETDQLLKSLHEFATRVRPSVLDDLGLQDAVESFLCEYRSRTGVDVTSRLRLHSATIPPKLGENVYRILQEALANVAAHAQIDRAELTIETDSDTLRMTVQDTGVGFEPRALKESTRLGILGMRERVELLNGQFDLTSSPGGGTRMSVVIPLRSDDRGSESDGRV
jgi:signal transduction histidine kinase